MDLTNVIIIFLYHHLKPLLSFDLPTTEADCRRHLASAKEHGQWLKARIAATNDLGEALGILGCAIRLRDYIDQLRARLGELQNGSIN